MRTVGGGGGTGVPGDPGAVRAGGRQVAEAGVAINDAAKALQDAGSEAALLWEGTAAEAFEAATRAVGAGTYTGGDVCELVDRVLSSYAEDLEAAQQDWAAAHAEFTAAQSRERSARAADPGDDPRGRDRDIRRAAGDVAAARSDMADAQQRALNANTEAAGRIDRCTGDLDDMTVAHLVTAPKGGGGGISSIGHLALDLIGFVPLFGEPADLINGVWYAAEGNNVDAAVSLAATAPFVGMAATGGKFVNRGVDAARAAEDAANTARAAERAAEVAATSRRAEERAAAARAAGNTDEAARWENVAAAGGRDLPLRELPRDYRRPTGFRNGVRDDVLEANRGVDGVVRDPLTRTEINPNGRWDMGHRPGFEFRRHANDAARRGIDRRSFLDEHNIPEHYRPELPASNRGHQLEAPDDFDGWAGSP